jgi:hypothetical protein
MNTPRLLLANITFAVIACVGGAPSEARDRPGTPNGGHTWYCAITLDERPAICAEFQNTATEKVGFMMEWTENGRLLTPDLSGRSQCLSGSVQFYHCAALSHWFVGVYSRRGFLSHRDYPEGFRVTNLAYDAEYCFRFRAIDKSDVWSGAWSGFTCARTPSPPEEPMAPPAPKVTGIQPTSGAGTVGAATPFKVLVEWSRPENTNQIGWYSVERFINQGWATVSKRRIDPARFETGEYEFLVDEPHAVGVPTERKAFRVCSENVEHRACSPAAWYHAIAHGKDKISGPVISAGAAPPRPTEMNMNNTTAQARVAPSDRATANYNPSVASAQSVGTPLASLPDLGALAARGAAIAMQDPLSAELRGRTGNAIRGFDIGMAAAEGQTGHGAGKQRIHDALNAMERPGFVTAVDFSLQRNRNANLAAVGATIANADPAVAAARTADADVFYWLGFDIASGIFGDPKAGARGNTATGAGSLGIRDALNPAAQRGFNDSVALHLSRSYR